MAKLTEKQASELQHLKHEINQAKSRLIDIVRKMESIKPSEAAKLGKIIGRLEHFQNT
jgi:tetrahydromethanopterin S-methyltransferase subunit G